MSGGALATVSSGKDKIRIFQEPIEQDDEFSHDGGEGEFGGFSVGSESLVKVSEDGIVVAGSEGGHVKDATHGGPATDDVSLAAVLPAVVVERRDSSEGGGPLSGFRLSSSGMSGEDVSTLTRPTPETALMRSALAASFASAARCASSRASSLASCFSNWR